MAELNVKPEVTLPAQVTLHLTNQEARILRRMCYFNKTISGKVTEKDGAWAGAAVDAFAVSVGSQLRDAGYSRSI